MDLNGEHRSKENWTKKDNKGHDGTNKRLAEACSVCFELQPLVIIYTSCFVDLFLKDLILFSFE